MRLFAAVRCPPAVEAALVRTMADLGREGRAAFTPRENLHLTLAFLGETDNLAGAVSALERSCTGGPFSVTLGGLGAFERLWWAGVLPAPRLEDLARRVQSALRREGFALEDRPWTPHVTLARRWQGPPPTASVEETAWAVEAVSLLESLRGPEGPVYRERRRFPL